MDWITGMQKAIGYIEDHITDEIDFDDVAKESFSSSYHFQRVFSILCGYTLGEYIRNRRLSLAGCELASGKAKVIDVALKFGYDSPDSFAKAFAKFHGITPSQARGNGTMLKSFSRLSIKISLEGGSIMSYRIENKPEMILTGYKKRFSGTPDNKSDNEHDFYISTRSNQYLIMGLAHDCDTTYNVITNFGNDGYDYYIASKLGDWVRNHLDEHIGEDAKRFENITIPSGLYLVCETEKCKYPTRYHNELRRQAISEWIPSSDYELADAPEIMVTHWYYDPEKPEVSEKRYIELWIPIEKR